MKRKLLEYLKKIDSKEEEFIKNIDDSVKSFEAER